MLYWFDDNRKISDIPGKRKVFFEMGRDRMTETDIDRINCFINEAIDKVISEKSGSDKTYYVPGWQAPDKWEGLPLQQIYDKAFPGDPEQCALWYGLITMKVFINRTDNWYVMKTEFAGRSFSQAVYWPKES